MKLNRRFVSIFLFSVFLSSCNISIPNSSSGTGSNSGNTESSERIIGQTPVYQGISIQTVDQFNGSISFGGFANSQKQTRLDPRMPAIDATFRQYIEADMPIDLSFQPFAHYAETNQDLIIRVRVYNPDQFEIISFTLNGYKYQSYQFERGSDSENLYLKVNSGSIPGPKEFTVDQIKFIDGMAIQDVIINGNQTVRIGVFYPIAPVVSINNLDVKQTSVSFYVNYNDPYQVLKNEFSEVRAYLFDGSQITHRQTVTGTGEQVLFSGIKVSSQYQYAVVAIYDLMDGMGLQRIFYSSGTVDTSAYVRLTNVNVTETTIQFNLNEEYPTGKGQLESLKLFLGNTLIKNITYQPSNTTYLIEGLLSGLNYRVEVTYQYEPSIQLGMLTTTTNLTVTTKAKAVPSVVYEGLSVSKVSAQFSVNITDADNVGTFDSIVVKRGEMPIQTFDTLSDNGTYQITQLLTNNDYRVITTYRYDLNDGQGLQTLTKTLDFKTNANAEPSGSIFAVVPGGNRVEFDYEYVDLDDVATSYVVELIKDNKVVATLPEDANAFTGLAGDTLYKIRLNIFYDLNDGAGLKTKVVESSFYTLPYIEVVSTSIINTERLTEGDTLVIESEVKNDAGVQFTHATINGIKYPVNELTTAVYIRVEIIIDNSFSGGNTEFVIEKLFGKIRNNERIFTITENNRAFAFINGDIIVESMTITDVLGNPLSIVMPGQVFLINIQFDNPTGYTIESINLSYFGTLTRAGQQFTLADDNSLVSARVSVYWSNTNIDFYLQQFTYRIDALDTKSKSVSNVYGFVISMQDTRPISVSTVQQLKEMRSGYHYRLVNDIDLSNVDWEPKDYQYMLFDGNGYTISGIKTVKTFIDTNVYFGLFRNLYYVNIKNLNLRDFLFMFSINNSANNASNQYEGAIGLLASNMSRANLQNITIQGELSLTNNTATNEWYNRVGGMAAQIDSTSMEQVFMDVVVVGDGYVGGIGGRMNNTSLNRIYVAGKVSGRNQVGAIASQGESLRVKNTYSSAVVQSKSTYMPSQVGGLFGYLYYSSISESFSVNEFDFTAMEDTQNLENAQIGGIASSGHGNTFEKVFSFATRMQTDQLARLTGHQMGNYENSFSLVQNDNGYATIDTRDNILAKFNNLFDMNLWINQGDYPSLKWTPLIRLTNLNAEERTISFGLTATGAGSSGQFTAIELFAGTEKIASLEPNQTNLYTFSNLLYNTTYFIKTKFAVVYAADDIIEVTNQFEAKTKALEGTPEVVFTKVYPGSDKVEFDFDLIDPQSYGQVTAIALLNQDYEVLQNLEDLSIREFTNLTTNTNYRLAVTYAYDLRDDLGEKTFVVYAAFVTNPYVDLISVDVLNLQAGEAIMANDMIVVQININNIDKVNFTRVKINDVWYTVNNFTDNRITISISAATLNTLGAYLLNVQQIEATHNALVYNYYMTSRNTVEFMINGEISAEQLEILDENLQPLEHVVYGEKYVVQITFDNPTGYLINAVQLNEYFSGEINADWLSQGNTVLRIPLTFNEYFNMWNNQKTIQLAGFNYSNEAVGLKNKLSTINDSIIVLRSKVIRPVSTPQELNLMEAGYHYQLVNDINLSGINWIPNNFSGIFDGNGYVISNLRVIRTITDVSFEFGLFYQVHNSIIKNVVLIDASVIVNLRTDNDAVATFYVGLLARSISYSQLDNILIDGDVQLSNFTRGNVYFGPIAAEAHTSNINRAYVTGYYYSSDIQSNDGNTYFGGMLGQMSSITIRNSYTNAKLTSIGNPNRSGWGNFMGGLYGYGTSNKILSSYVKNEQRFENTNFYGAIVGYGSVTLNDFFNASVDQNGNSITQLGQHSISMNNSFTLGVENNLDFVMQQMQAVWDLDIWSFKQTYPSLKRPPLVGLKDIEVTLTSISFVTRVIDFDEVGEIKSIELYLNGALVQSLTNLSVRSFEGLRYSTNYVIKVLYEYDYQDGTGPKTIEVSQTVRTVERDNTPTVDINNLNISDNYVQFDLLVTDVEDVMTIQSIELFNDQQVLVATADNVDLLDILFDSLNADSAYTIVVTYMYNYGDAYGDQVVVITQAIQTRPSIEIAEVKNLNSTSILVGDELNMQITFVNPSAVIVSQVKVNGVWYNLIRSSTNTTSGRIVIQVTEAMGGGNTEFAVEAIRYAYNSQTFDHAFDGSKKISTFINGAISITGLSIINSENEIMYYTLRSQNIIIKVNISNPSLYTVSSVTYSGTRGGTNSSITMSEDKQSFTFVVFGNSSSNFNISITGFAYSNETLSTRNKLVGGTYTYTLQLISTEIIEIRTIEEFSAIRNATNRHYKLMADLDFAGIDWNPFAFNGIFDGNGFTIRNLSHTRLYEEVDGYFGLFYSLQSSIIKNLTIENTTVIMTYRTSVNRGGYLYAGVLASFIDSNNTIENIRIVNADLSLTMTGQNFYGYTYLGLLAGYTGNYNLIKDIVIEGGLLYENSTGYIWGRHVGALVGQNSSLNRLENVEIDVDMTTSAYIYDYFAGYNSSVFISIKQSSVVGFRNGNPISYSVE